MPYFGSRDIMCVMQAILVEKGIVFENNSFSLPRALVLGRSRNRKWPMIT